MAEDAWLSLGAGTHHTHYRWTYDLAPRLGSTSRHAATPPRPLARRSLR
jgi:hypothetical protein